MIRMLVPDSGGPPSSAAGPVTVIDTVAIRVGKPGTTCSVTVIGVVLRSMATSIDGVK